LITASIVPAFAAPLMASEDFSLESREFDENLIARTSVVPDLLEERGFGSVLKLAKAAPKLGHALKSVAPKISKAAHRIAPKVTKSAAKTSSISRSASKIKSPKIKKVSGAKRVSGVRTKSSTKPHIASKGSRVRTPKSSGKPVRHNVKAKGTGKTSASRRPIRQTKVGKAGKVQQSHKRPTQQKGRTATRPNRNTRTSPPKHSTAQNKKPVDWKKAGHRAHQAAHVAKSGIEVAGSTAAIVPFVQQQQQQQQ